jgi:hypothetical protein
MPRGPQGHRRKLDHIMRELGPLPDGLRPVELLRRIHEAAKQLGYDERKGEFPSRQAVMRWLNRAGNMGNTDDASNDPLR